MSQTNHFYAVILVGRDRPIEVCTCKLTFIEMQNLNHSFSHCVCCKWPNDDDDGTLPFCQTYFDVETYSELDSFGSSTVPGHLRINICVFPESQSIPIYNLSSHFPKCISCLKFVVGCQILIY